MAKAIHKTTDFSSPEQEAYLNLIRTAAQFSISFERLFKSHGLSESTYNILRILRGTGGRGLSCGQIGARMVARVPDLTRLIDRLERAGLAERARDASDRRIVLATITPGGLQTLARLDQPVLDLHRQQLSHMSDEDLGTLNRLLVAARREGDATPAASDGEL
ncbi:MAG: MarR family transcriptional regulator [Planctomycetota bacterium]|nr:MarR family transcriptional regulator [Planctomycetota bacterium]